MIIIVQIGGADSATTTIPTPTPSLVSTTVPITVTNTLAPEPVVASFTITPTSGTLPFSVTITDTSPDFYPIIINQVHTGSYKWRWSFSSRGDSSGNTINYPPLSSDGYNNDPPVATGYIPVGTAEYCLTNSTGELEIWTTVMYGSPGYNLQSAPQYIHINSLPDIVSSFTATPASGPAPLTVQFESTTLSTPTNPIIKRTWDFGDGQTAENNASQSHTYTISGVYTAKYSAYGYGTCNPTVATNTITVLSPIAPGATTSPTLSPNQTATTTSLTTVAAQTSLPAATLTATVTATPSSSFYYTPPPTTTTQKVFTPIPTVTPTQKSPLGIEFSILAISAAILIVMSQYRKP